MAEGGPRRDSGADRVHGALTALVTPALADAGFVLEELRLTPAGKHRVLRVLVDRAESAAAVQDASQGPDVAVPGLSLDEVAEASRTVSATLDAVSGSADPLGSTPYTLEVSSPGVDRPLTLPRHFRRNVGRLVVLRTAGGEDVTGRIARSDEELALRTDHGELAVAWDQVVTGQVQVEFTRRGPVPDPLDDEHDDEHDDSDDDEHDDSDDDEDEEG